MGALEHSSDIGPTPGKAEGEDGPVHANPDLPGATPGVAEGEPLEQRSRGDEEARGVGLEGAAAPGSGVVRHAGVEGGDQISIDVDPSRAMSPGEPAEPSSP